MTNPVLTEGGTLAGLVEVGLIYLGETEPRQPLTRGRVARMPQSEAEFGQDENASGLQAWVPTPENHNDVEYLQFDDPDSGELSRFFVTFSQQIVGPFDTTRFALQDKGDPVNPDNVDFDPEDFDRADFA